MMISRQMGDLPSPEQFEAIEHRASAAAARDSYASKIPPAKQLQNALRALGVAQGDPKLSKLKVDGVIGPATAKAATYAFATYFNAPNVMSAEYVRQHINYLTQQVTAYVEAHGGVVLPPSSPVKKISMTLPSLPTIPESAAASSGLPFDTKYIWWGVAGLSVLVILSMAASVTRRRRVAAQPDES